eukprot:TRINITY_DN622_c0_g1_i1.p1 TRINITY_DN622_c0_g1~~TRINITY_DN622_c0_g1_i1.p1  ORF type:complete len:263 (-),score=99.33 TRINITY_DN622_c0_g1_i1:98-865(-)
MAASRVLVQESAEADLWVYEGSVFVIHMKNGENRFNPTFVSRLHELLDRVEAEQAKNDREGKGGALVFVGEGKFFSNGLDLNYVMSGEGKIEDIVWIFQKVCARLYSFPIPTVAAVNGHMYAGGMMFALSCDYRFMREDRGFACMPEIDLKMVLTPGMNAIVQSKISDQRVLRDVVLLGKKYNARESLQAGIVDVISDEQSLLPKAISFALTNLVPKVASSGRTYANLRQSLYPQAVAHLLHQESVPETVLRSML